MTDINVRRQSRKSKHRSGERYIGPVEYLVLKVICHLNGLYNWRIWLRIYFFVVWWQNIHCCPLRESDLHAWTGGTAFGIRYAAVGTNGWARHGTPPQHRPKRMTSKQADHTKCQNDHGSISFVSPRLALAASGRTEEVGTVAVAGRRGQSPQRTVAIAQQHPADTSL